MTISRAVPANGSVLVLAMSIAGCFGGTTAVQVDADDSGCRVNPPQVAAGAVLDFTVTNRGTKPTSFSLREGDDTLLETGAVKPNETWKQTRVQLTSDNPGDVTAVCEPDLKTPGVPVDFTLTN